MHGGEMEPVRELSTEEIKAVRVMLDAYDKGQWLGKLIFKVVIGAGGIIAFLAVLKGHLVTLIRG